eukprot:CAMPEP_0184495320 /NCGR_PEP_ID=MMETSP0113_2-20130426/30962_1 /TAXON_ID=91329 /ORGANISM="Norrisiella sphaerica, Strain BC52" /LENGTH=175 /DNA_ID=CAMNT_0026881461 /DNA_START=842 /DNA_END=1366 /DNA_ORIENTATION=-
MDELINVVSPTRYFKLNLHAFRRHGTLEFRQHSATTNYMKVGYWIRLLVAFVNNAARLPPPKSFKASYGSDDHKMRLVKLNMMFQWLVKDGALKKHYIRRANFLSNNNRGARDSQDDVVTLAPVRAQGTLVGLHQCLSCHGFTQAEPCLASQMGITTLKASNALKHKNDMVMHEG